MAAGRGGGSTPDANDDSLYACGGATPSHHYNGGQTAPGCTDAVDHYHPVKDHSNKKLNYSNNPNTNDFHVT